MENNVWDEFLDEAVRDIRDKVTRAEVREELFDHLEDRKERFMRFGDNEDEAERKTIEIMGDCTNLKYKLGEIHTRCYVSDLKAALLEIFVGFLFTFFTINLFGVDILKLIGKFCIFAGVYELRNCNSTLKKAWYWYLLSIAWEIFSKVSKAMPFFARADNPTSLGLTVIGTAVMVIQVYLIFTGIEKLCNSAVKGTDNTAPSMKTAIGAYILASIIAFSATFPEISIIAYIALPLFIYILYKLWQVYKTVSASEYRTETVSQFDKKGRSILAGIIGTFLISTVAVCAVVSMPRIKSEVYVPEKSSEVQKMRLELIERGMTEELAEILPDEEIKNCFPLNSEGKIYVSQNKPQIENGPMIYVATVPLEDENDMVARYIQAFIYPDSKNIHGYRDSIISEESLHPSAGSDSYGIFYQKDGVLYKQEPIRLFETAFNTVNGMEFRTVKGADKMYGYVAATGYLPHENKNHCTSYLTQKRLWNIPYQNAEDEFTQVTFSSDMMTMMANSSQWSLSKNACTSFIKWTDGNYYRMFEASADADVIADHVTQDEEPIGDNNGE